MRWLLRWWSDYRWRANLGDAWGFRTAQRSGEDFGGWLSRETERWVKRG